MKKLNVKKLIIAAASAAAICLGANELIAAAKPKAEPADCIRSYIVGEYNGFVACYDIGTEEPFLITQRKVSELKPLDELLLANGVEVKGARAMSRALEDLCS